jgi:hypothetical protein
MYIGGGVAGYALPLWPPFAITGPLSMATSVAAGIPVQLTVNLPGGPAVNAVYSINGGATVTLSAAGTATLVFAVGSSSIKVWPTSSTTAAVNAPITINVTVINGCTANASQVPALGTVGTCSAVALSQSCAFTCPADYLLLGAPLVCDPVLLTLVGVQSCQPLTWSPLPALGVDPFATLARAAHCQVWSSLLGGIVVMGGLINGTSYQSMLGNDVYVMDDQTYHFRQVSAAASWPVRAYHSCEVDAVSRTMFVLGGVITTGTFPIYVNSFYNDIWSSTDGLSWTQLTAAAP